ncbi:uncharacterized protein GGS22DRAFT_192611 [Annulohypoxylon maeteangense]|uniref:uncharacterized protein n=1 Tax=Annulohypoxylon maeteangense TaxID=1927788 RepID=UPI0020082E32|nr:uncharacterized protein GGS22DRAFT_192611 [Annulohypoxylon maeteangense]KAI0881124.1 hypothetical protein GGS22DRAFT_192611 [Annulohypoxylon maeteangense]
MVSPTKKKGRVSPHLFEHVFADPVAEAEANANAEAATSQKRKLRPRNNGGWTDELKKTTQEADDQEKAPEEKEVFVVRNPAEEDRGCRRGRGRPRGRRNGRGRGRGRGRGGATQDTQGSKEPVVDDRLPYGFPAEGQTNRQISKQPDQYLYDADGDSSEAEKVPDSTTGNFR